eukprot:COSAG05_NODE_1027_length_6117_cov_7.351778_1_plen_296_part_00
MPAIPWPRPPRALSRAAARPPSSSGPPRSAALGLGTRLSVSWTVIIIYQLSDMRQIQWPPSVDGFCGGARAGVGGGCAHRFDPGEGERYRPCEPPFEEDADRPEPAEPGRRPLEFPCEKIDSQKSYFHAMRADGFAWFFGGGISAPGCRGLGGGRRARAWFGARALPAAAAAENAVRNTAKTKFQFPCTAREWVSIGISLPGPVDGGGVGSRPRLRALRGTRAAEGAPACHKITTHALQQFSVHICTHCANAAVSDVRSDFFDTHALRANRVLGVAQEISQKISQGISQQQKQQG